MTSRHRTGCSPIWMTCFCADSRAAMRKNESEGRLARYIQKGDVVGAEKALRKMRRPEEVSLIVKRRHLSSSYQCLVDRNSDPFINFYQECSPVLWAMDCQQWRMLPLLERYGHDANRPQPCRRWTYLCAQNSRPNTAPYKRFWTRGKYTYQAALDYFFASVYEFLGDDVPSFNGKTVPSPLPFYFSQLPALLSKGVDVHRIDSVIVFNSLAYSFDRYLCHYTNEEAEVPDIPETDDAFVEMTAVKTLIRHGFSQFECMEYLYPCCNWFGILLSLLCHPKIESYGDTLLPPIIQQAALFLINLLSLRCAFPSIEEFKENLENLQLRKIYSKRYSERRYLFNVRLSDLHSSCHAVTVQPMPLRLLARNMVRKQIGGKCFPDKVACLNLPQRLSDFVMYIETDHLKACAFPEPLVAMARGENIYWRMPGTPGGDEEQHQSTNASSSRV